MSSKTYKRNDRQGESRLGFIAQDIEAAVPAEWGNIVSTMEKTIDLEDPASESITLKTLDYARLTAVLWQVCRNLDRRVKELEDARSG